MREASSMIESSQLVLAALISFALAPATTWFARLGIGRVTASIAVVLLTLAMVGGFAAVAAQQLFVLARELHRYVANVRDKVRSLSEAAAESSGLVETIRRLRTR